MPRQMTVPYSAGMLFPEPTSMELGGTSLRVLEFRVRDIGAVERDLAALCENARAHLWALEDRREYIQTNRPDDTKGRNDIIRRILIEADKWPPRMGSTLFGDLLSTPEGESVYLWRALHRTNKALTVPWCLAIRDAMTPDEWSSLDKVLFGGQSWEVHKPETEDEDEQRRKRSERMRFKGQDWSLAIKFLLKRGMSIREIGNLFISQLYFMSSDGADREVWVPDRPT